MSFSQNDLDKPSCKQSHYQAVLAQSLNVPSSIITVYLKQQLQKGDSAVLL